MKAGWIAAVAIAMVVSQGRANARGDSDANAKVEAKARFVAGQSHYNLNEFADALVEFKEAYRLLPDPVFLYNLGQCERQLGHWDEAVRFYRSFLREQPKAPNRQEVLHKIEEIEGFLKNKAAEPEKDTPAVDESTPAAAVPALVTEPVRATPEPTEPAAAAPEAKLEPAGPSLLAEPAVSATPARADLTSAPPAPAVNEPPHWYNHWWFWTGTAVIAAGAGVAIYAATSSHSASAPGSTLGTKAVF